MPTSIVFIDNSAIYNHEHGIAIFAGSYTIKDKTAPFTPNLPPYEIPLVGKIEVTNTTVDNISTYTTSSFKYISLFEDAKLSLINVNAPDLEINLFGDAHLTVQNSTIGTIIARQSSTVTVRNSTVSKIYDALSSLLNIYLALNVDPLGLDSVITIEENSTITLVEIAEGGDLDISDSIIYNLTASSVDVDHKVQVTVDNVTVINEFTLGPNTEGDIVNLTNVGLTLLQGDAYAHFVDSTLAFLGVIQGATCLVNTSYIGMLQDGIIGLFGVTTVNNYQISGSYGTNYINNTIIDGLTSIGVRQFASIAAIAPAGPGTTIVIVEDCANSFTSILAAEYANITMKNVSTSYLIGLGNSIIKAENMTIAAVQSTDSAQVNIINSAIAGMYVPLDLGGGVIINMPICIVAEKNSKLTLINVTTNAVSAYDSSELVLDNVSISILEIATLGKVRVTSSYLAGGGQTILGAIKIHDIPSVGNEAGDVIIEYAVIGLASVFGSANITLSNCYFGATGALLYGIVVSGANTVNINTGVISGTCSNYTKIDAATKATIFAAFLNNIEVNDTATVNINDYVSIPGLAQLNYSINAYHNAKVNVENGTLGLVRLFNDTTTKINATEVVMPSNTGIAAILTAHKAYFEANNSDIKAILCYREDKSTQYAGKVTNSDVYMAYLLGYTRLRLETVTVYLYAVVMAGVDNRVYALEVINSTFFPAFGATLSAVSWAPTA
jgi:hypothetical protein